MIDPCVCGHEHADHANLSLRGWCDGGCCRNGCRCFAFRRSRSKTMGLDTGFVIQRADGTFYLWDDRLNGVRWVPDAGPATIWYSRKSAQRVAELHAGASVVTRPTGSSEPA